MGNRTPLYEIHRTLGAKLVDFGGWDMPLHYGSQIEEHHAVRNHCGVFDVSHMTVVDVTGVDAHAYLQGLLANDVAKLTIGQALYSCMLNHQGGVIDDLIVYRRDNGYRLVLNCATRDKDLKWMAEQRDEMACTVEIAERRDLAMVALQGPHSDHFLQSALPASLATQAIAMKAFYGCEDKVFQVARTGYTGERGFEVILPNDAVEELWTKWVHAGVAAIGLGARDTLRLEAGMHLYGADMDETVSPLSCGLGWTVSWEATDRTFIGRDALLQQMNSGVDETWIGLVLRERGVLRAGMPLRFEQAPQGVITSGTFSPTLGCSIALARVPATSQGKAEVEVRRQWLSIEVVKPVFVRFGHSLLPD